MQDMVNIPKTLQHQRAVLPGVASISIPDEGLVSEFEIDAHDVAAIEPLDGSLRPAVAPDAQSRGAVPNAEFI